MRRRCGIIALASFAGLLMAQTEPTNDGQHLDASSGEFNLSRDATLKKLREDGFTKKLLTGALGAASTDEVKAEAAKLRVKRGAKLAGVSVGAPNAKYDVILQPGHYGRTKGATGASGAKVSEQEIVAYLVGSVAMRLKASGFNVIVVPADNTVAKNAMVFLAVHAEGSASPCSAGPSLAYKEGTTPYAMHAVGLGISRAMGYDYKNFRADGYTKNSSHYYMFNRVNAGRLTGLLEIGEITCSNSERAMLVNVDRIAANLGPSAGRSILLIHRVDGCQR